MKKKKFVSRFYYFFSSSAYAAEQAVRFTSKILRPESKALAQCTNGTSWVIDSNFHFIRCAKWSLIWPKVLLYKNWIAFSKYEFFSLTLSQQNSHYLYYITSTVFLDWKRSSELHTNPSSLYDAYSLTLREKTNQKTDHEQFIRSTAPTARPLISVRPAET